MSLLSSSRPLGIGVGLAVVSNDAVKARIASGLEELDGDMAGAEYIEQRHGQHGLDKDFKRTPANQAGVVLGILIEIEGSVRGFSWAMTSRAACQTSASTQPPPMVPAMEPSSRISILAL